MRLINVFVVIMFLSASVFAEEQDKLDGSIEVGDKEISKTVDQLECDENDTEDECEVIEEDVLEYEDTSIVITV